MDFNTKQIKILKDKHVIDHDWQLCSNQDLLSMRDELWEKAQQLNLTKTEPKPSLWIFKDNHWGETVYYTGVPFNAIGLERVFLQAPECARETLIHEIAHICAKNNQHGAKWKQAGNLLGKDYGIKVSAADDPDDIGLNPSLIKYRLKCTTCGKLFAWIEPSPEWKAPSKFCCGYCDYHTLKRYKLP